MTRDEALKLLRKAPRDDMPSKVIAGLSRREVTELVAKQVHAWPEDEPLDHHITRRLMQAVKDNQRVPQDLR